MPVYKVEVESHDYQEYFIDASSEQNAEKAARYEFHQATGLGVSHIDASVTDEWNLDDPDCPTADLTTS
jgi:hypothetical protein